MKYLIYLFLLLLSAKVFASEYNLKIATFNMQGWIDTSSRRSIELKKLFDATGMMNGVALMITQESIEQEPLSTTKQLASELGWRSFSKRRVSDNEGLGVLYPHQSNISDLRTLQIKSKHSPTDYSRMALSGVLEIRNVGKLRFMNIHLAHGAVMGSTRKKQLREALIWLEQLERNDPSDLIIFGGDFNTNAKELRYAGEFSILTKSRFKFTMVKPSKATYTYFNEKNGQKRLIDHFFISSSASELKVKNSSSKIFIEPTSLGLSDHNIVVLELKLLKDGQ
jgi:endonuclease/exonuclease/phosphatase family metal-dependent hydrolase